MTGLNTTTGSVLVNDVNAECNYEVRTPKNVLSFTRLLQPQNLTINSDFMTKNVKQYDLIYYYFDLI